MHGKKFFGRLDERGLKLVFAGFFVALAVPAVVLIAQAYGQLKWEAFRSTQISAEEISSRIDSTLRTALAAEEAHAFGDYAFLVVAGDAKANFVQRSPLSAFPVASALPGVMGYFQIDADGRFSSPLLPPAGIDADRYGIGAEERGARAALVAELRGVLAQNRLVRPARDEPAVINAPGAAQDSLQDRLGGRAAATAMSSELAAKAERPAASFDAADAAPTETAGAVAAQATAVPAPPVADPTAPADAPQAAFDRLVVGARAPARAAPPAVAETTPSLAEQKQATPREADKLRVDALPRTTPAAGERQKRVEQARVPEAEVPYAITSPPAPAATHELRVHTFESELDPFELGVLDTGQFVLFRNVWREDRRLIQGALIDRSTLLAHLVETPYRSSRISRLGDLRVSFQGRPLETFSAAGPVPYASAPRELVGALLHRARLSPPFGELELEFDISTLPRAPGAALLGWVSVTLAFVLCGGFLLMYRFAAGQMRLARQQQDFVSAVSHELKTPLTSIRMYGEILKAGWANDAKKQTYYDYIHSESERLSRLIENVLQLARLTRGSQRIDAKRVRIAELLDMVQSKVGTQIDRAGFTLSMRNDAPAAADIIVDTDCFAQIFINLVDNALKFAASAERKVVEITCRLERDKTALFTVRDFGPGVPKAQMRKIFEQFYRAESELTRETVGTGIGLSLVRQLATAMGGRVEMRNCEPGAEFRLHFKTG